MNLFRFKEKEDEQVGVYYQTSNYSKFVLIEGNREINPRHVEGLKKSIQKIGLITPIQVDKNFKLGNGQHRFFACKALGYPVTYQLLPDHIDLEKIMIDININNENWSNDDFCNRWAKKEQKENPTSHMSMPYNIFQTCRNFKLHHKTLIILIYGSYKDAYSNLYRSGKLELENEEQIGNLTLKSHLKASDLNTAILQSHLVICRPGYSTIMDLAKLGKKAIFIPTPGQTEQEYLADYCMKKNICFLKLDTNFLITKLRNGQGIFSLCSARSILIKRIVGSIEQLNVMKPFLLEST